MKQKAKKKKKKKFNMLEGMDNKRVLRDRERKIAKKCSLRVCTACKATLTFTLVL